MYGKGIELQKTASYMLPLTSFAKIMLPKVPEAMPYLAFPPVVSLVFTIRG